MQTTNELANVPDVEIASLKDGKLGMKFAGVLVNGERPSFKLDVLKIPFEPSVYNGTGLEIRKGLVMEIGAYDATCIQAFEEKIKKKLNIPTDKWNSCVKPDHRLRAKINMGGEDPCAFAGKAPEDGFRGRSAVAALVVKGIYVQRQATGLILDVQAMKVGDLVKTDQTDYVAMLGSPA